MSATASSASMPASARAGLRHSRLMRRLRRLSRSLLGGALMAIWLVLPLFPLLGAAYSWWAGVR